MPMKPGRTAQKPAKPAAKAKTPTKPPEALKRLSEPTYTMPREVADWIDRAQSTINHQKGEIERLKAENKDLKAWRQWAERRILRSEHED